MLRTLEDVQKTIAQIIMLLKADVVSLKKGSGREKKLPSFHSC